MAAACHVSTEVLLWTLSHPTGLSVSRRDPVSPGAVEVEPLECRRTSGSCWLLPINRTPREAPRQPQANNIIENGGLLIIAFRAVGSRMTREVRSAARYIRRRHRHARTSASPTRA